MWEWEELYRGPRSGLMEGGYQCRHPEDTVWARRRGGGVLEAASVQGDMWTGPRSVLRCLLTRRPGDTALGRGWQSREGRGVGITGRIAVYPARAWARGAPAAALQSSPSTPWESAGHGRAWLPGLRALLSSSPALTSGLLIGVTRVGSASYVSQGISMFVPQDPHLRPGGRFSLQYLTDEKAEL